MQFCKSCPNLVPKDKPYCDDCHLWHICVDCDEYDCTGCDQDIDAGRDEEPGPQFGEN